MGFKNYKLSMRNLGALLLTVMLTCNNAYAVDQLCVYADDFGDLVRKTINIKSSGDASSTDNSITILDEGESEISDNTTLTNVNGWTDTGIDLIAGKQLQIKSTGDVDLCKGTGIFESYIFQPDNTNASWQNSGVYVTAGQKYSIKISGTGELYVYIGESADSNPNFTSLNLTPVAPWESSYTSTSNRSNSYFKLTSSYTTDNNRLDSVSSSALGMMPTGNIYFKYISSSSTQAKVSITTKKGCSGSKGQFLYAYISTDSTTFPPSDINPLTETSGINLHPYAQADDTQTPPRKAGLYNSTVPGNGGRLWLKIIDSKTVDWNGDGAKNGDGDYTVYDSSSKTGSNDGKYIVTVVTAKEPPTGFTTAVNEIVTPIRTLLMGDDTASPKVLGLTERMYKGVTKNINFIQGVRALMALSIVLMMFSYMLVGFKKFTQKDMVAYMIKLSIVITLISPTSWDFFYNNLFVFFIKGTDDLIKIMTSQFVSIAQSDSTDPTLAMNSGSASTDTFAFLNATLAKLFAKETNIKILGLMSLFPVGFLMALVIYFGVFFFLFVLIKALLLYIISIIMVSLLLFLAPLFISMLLFKKTHGMFDKWWKQLLNFAIQPVVLFMVLAIFNVFIYATLYKMLSFAVCYQCITEINLGISTMVGLADGALGDKFCLFHSYLPWGVDASQDIATKLEKVPVSLFTVFIFILLCHAMVKMTDWVVAMSNSMTAGLAGANLGGTAQNAIKQGMDTVKATGGAAVGAAKFSAKTLDSVTGHAISDQGKKAARKVLPNFMTKGGSDGMGGITAASDRFTTSREKKAMGGRQKMFNSMTSAQQKAYKDEQKIASMGNKREYLERMARENEVLGAHLGGNKRRELMKIKKEDAAESAKAGGKGRSDQEKAEALKKTGENSLRATTTTRATIKAQMKEEKDARKNATYIVDVDEKTGKAKSVTEKKPRDGGDSNS